MGHWLTRSRPFDNALNFSLEPDEFELEPTGYTGDSAITKRHTMPGFDISSTPPNSHYAGPAHPISTSPKRAETYLSTIEGLNIARNKKLIAGLLSKIDPGTTPPSPGRGSEPSSDTSNVAQSLQVGNPITDMVFAEWPVPRFFLDQIPPSPEAGPADDLTLEDSEGPKPVGNIQSKDIEDNEISGHCENAGSVPPLNHSYSPKLEQYFKVTHSDSGFGSSTKSYRPGPYSAVGSSHRHIPSKKGM